MPDKSRPLSLGITAISALCLLLVLPIFLTQVRSIFKVDTFAKASGRRSPLPKGSEGTGMLETSDASSMFLRPSDEWNPQSVMNQASFLTPKSLIGKKNQGCCC